MKTKLAIIGDPVSHSKSPIIHKTVLRELGRDCEYNKILVKKGQLEEFINRLKKTPIDGFNITMPHKRDIIPYLDYVDDDALLFEAVNTVKMKNGKLFGYNTDGQASVMAIKNTGVSCKDKNIVILGAGGVASTVSLKIAAEGAKSIVILNRSIGSAEAIANKVSQHSKAHVKVGALTYENICESMPLCDILINCTPLGMEGIADDYTDLSFISALPKGALVYDLIYNPPETKFLKTAKSLGYKILNGMDMLIYQGLLADEIFLDCALDFSLYKQKIENNLKNLKKI